MNLKVTVLSTFDRLGGAAEAAFRHVEALRSAGVDARMLVRTAREDLPWISKIGSGFFFQKLMQFHQWNERFRFISQAARKEDWFSFSIGDQGHQIVNHPWIQDADVINPHWIQKGYISISELTRLGQLGKYMIWHLQDMWAFTGGCHYSGACRGYLAGCGQCPYLKRPSPMDLSARIHSKKAHLYKQIQFQISASSQWLQQEAQRSSLFQEKAVFHLPMGVNTEVYTPGNMKAARKTLGLPEGGTIFLFAAMNANDHRKGFKELTQAMFQLANKLPIDQRDQISLAILGRFDSSQFSTLPFHLHTLGFRSDRNEIINAYRAANAFILPSLEDNLPNTVLEAMSCGTPVIAFDAGGVPEMVDHEVNGLLAEVANSEALSTALKAFIYISPTEQARWKRNAREAMESRYSYSVVAAKHIDHYQKELGS